MRNVITEEPHLIRTAVIISNLELDALNHEILPHEARSLYLICIRPYMDYATGVVGIRRRLSYQMFSEKMFIARRRGSTAPEYTPSKQQLRTMIDQLVMVGLLVKCKEKQIAAPMVFSLPLAISDAHYLNEEQHESNTESVPRKKPSGKMSVDELHNTGVSSEEQHTSGLPDQSISTFSGDQKFKKSEVFISDDWYPSQKTINILKKLGIPITFTKNCIDEFIQYWLERGEARYSWNSSFISNVKYRWREKQLHIAQKSQFLKSKPDRNGLNWDNEDWIKGVYE